MTSPFYYAICCGWRKSHYAWRKNDSREANKRAHLHRYLWSNTRECFDPCCRRPQTRPILIDPHSYTHTNLRASFLSAAAIRVSSCTVSRYISQRRAPRVRLFVCLYYYSGWCCCRGFGELRVKMHMHRHITREREGGTGADWCTKTRLDIAPSHFFVWINSCNIFLLTMSLFFLQTKSPIL